MTIYKKLVIFVLTLATIFSLASVAFAAGTVDSDSYVKSLQQTYPELADYPYYAIYYLHSDSKIISGGMIEITFSKEPLVCFWQQSDKRYMLYTSLHSHYFYRKRGDEEEATLKYYSSNSDTVLVDSSYGPYSVFSNYDIKDKDSGEVVFPQVAPPSYQSQAGEVVLNQVGKELKVLLPVGLAILAALLLVLLIRRLIKSFL